MNESLAGKDRYIKYIEDTGERVEDCIETHISTIILTKEEAYKFYKPLNLGWYDASTLEQRKYFSERAMDKGKLWAPDIYKEMGEVKNDNGEIEDYFIKMRRFDSDCMMDNLLEKGEITEEHTKQIADIIHSAHAQLETTPDIVEYGGIGNIGRIWYENFEDMKPFIGTTIDRENYETIEKNIWNFINDNIGLLDSRLEYTIEDHGDFHSGNLLVEDGKVKVFDPIEFNPAFSCGDRIRTPAFISMDLKAKGYENLAQSLETEYLKKTDDDDAESLLLLHKANYAFVRGKVKSIQLSTSELSGADKEKLIDEAKHYFEISKDYSKSLVRENGTR